MVILTLVGLDLRDLKELWTTIHGKKYIRFEILYVINVVIFMIYRLQTFYY